MGSPIFGGMTGSTDRISPRHSFEAKIRIRLERGSKKLSLQGWARDLSESGLGAFVAEALALGEVVTLEVPLTDTEQQTIPAKVVRAVGTEVGFQFTALSAAQRQQIQARLKGRPAIPYHSNRQ
jgi:c-di-GMP-binding flagellar brake protein YcgR